MATLPVNDERDCSLSLSEKLLNFCMVLINIYFSWVLASREGINFLGLARDTPE